jgi:UV excision repair protein RAD23
MNSDDLRNTAQMQQLRQLIAQNPTAIQPLLQQLASANPGLPQNPEALIQALADSDDNGDDDGIPPGAQVISVTEEERAAIERVMSHLFIGICLSLTETAAGSFGVLEGIGYSGIFCL